MDTAQPLRDRLVAAGVDILESEGLAGLILRAITRRTGVSHGAPRRYFPTHRGLLAAIARTGLEDLTARLAPVLTDTATPARQRLIHLAEVYLRFAEDRLEMFELMFRHDLLAGAGGDLRATALPLFEGLAALVAEAAPGQPDSRQRALSIWTQLHGLAVLSAGQSLDLVADPADRPRLIARAVQANLV
jgi:AcrR family transcriptional regulator